MNPGSRFVRLLFALGPERARRVRLPRSLSATLLLLAGGAVHAEIPLSLFNGSSLLGWNSHGTWSAKDGMLATGGDGTRSLLTAVPFADLHLECDYNETAPMGAKLRLWANHDDVGGISVDLDNLGAPAGVGGIEQLSHSSLTMLPPGWHHLTVDASHGRLSVRVDSQPSGSATNLGARAGLVGFEANGAGSLQVKNVKLTPLSLNNLFNGTDLSGWKSIAHRPDAKGGMGHTMEKTLTLGIGGGSTKAHEAKWTVNGGSIHGQDGPGGLENATSFEDAVFHIIASVKGPTKPDDVVALAVRAQAGQMDTGYQIGVGPYAGGIEHLAKRPPLHTEAAVDETIVLAGRTVAIWVNGNLATVSTDTRPEGSSTAAGARTTAGTATLILPNGADTLDVRQLTGTSLPRSYGLPAKAPAPAPVVSVAVAAPAAAPAPQAAGPSATEQALLQQQRATQQKEAADQANKQRVASLTNQALSTNDPQQQMSLYSQVIQIDPSNAAAIQGFKEAQGKVQAQQAAQQQATTAEQQQQEQEQTREATTATQLSKAQGAFLNGHLAEAAAALSVAERLSPNNPAVRDLRSRLSSAQAVRSRIWMLTSMAGLLALLGVLAAWMRRRRQQRFPMLEIVRGFDQGQSFPLDKDLVRIGAVSSSGGQKNDIVLHDVDHSLSRFHCEVARKNGQLYVTDLASSNGTRLNGEPLKPNQPELLRRGATITLANNVDLRFGYDRRAGKAN